MNKLFLVIFVIGISFLSGRISADDTVMLDENDSIAIAINNSLELVSIKTKQDIDKLSISEAFRNFFPSLSVSYIQSDSIVKRGDDTRTKTISVSSEIVVYDGGEKKLSYDIAKLQLILSRNDYRMMLNKIISDTRNAYLKILYERKAIDIYRKSLEKGKMQLLFVTKEYELGEATKLNKLEIETKVNEIELNLKQSQENYQTELKNFKIMLKLDWQTPIDIEGNLDDYLVSSLDSSVTDDLLISLALANRKEIESADVEFEIGKRKYYIADHAYVPKVALGLNYSLSGEEYMPREKSWGVSLKLSSLVWGNSLSHDSRYDEENNDNSRKYSQNASVSILDSMSVKRNVAETKNAMLTAKANTRNIRQQMAVEVSSLFQSLNNGWDLINMSKKQVEMYNSLLEIETMKVSLGDSRRYDFMEKEIERNNAEIKYISALISYISQSASLELAIGQDVGYFGLVKRKDGKSENIQNN
ncbi:MAG: TolC family protein [Spirochaetes bacterium]|nr:TolC family protein [Spirochaetota bacterium]